MNQQYKACPKCKRPAAVTEMRCDGCGRVFRTLLPREDQTQMLAAAPDPSLPATFDPGATLNHPGIPPQSAPTQSLHVVAPGAAPAPMLIVVAPSLEAPEWLVSATWNWIGLLIGIGLCFLLGRWLTLGSPSWIPEPQNSLALLASGALTSYCALRIRRLYSYAVPSYWRWLIPTIVTVILAATGGSIYQRWEWTRHPPQAVDMINHPTVYPTYSTPRSGRWVGGAATQAGTRPGPQYPNLSGPAPSQPPPAAQPVSVVPIGGG
ncbi:MAG TPA: hypothetical protein VFJ58_27980 [Armatimonadota bacterium]|nr:hypothetical protein [Armatimonadota bacterium]